MSLLNRWGEAKNKKEFDFYPIALSRGLLRSYVNQAKACLNHSFISKAVIFFFAYYQVVYKQYFNQFGGVFDPLG